MIPASNAAATNHDVQQANNIGPIVPATILTSFPVTIGVNALHTIKDPIAMVPNLGAAIINVPASLVNGVVQSFGGSAPLMTIPHYQVKPKTGERSMLINDNHNYAMGF